MKDKITEKNSSTDLKIGSLFDGIGVFLLAASRWGITPIWTSGLSFSRSARSDLQ